MARKEKFVVNRTRKNMVHLIAICKDCEWRNEDYIGGTEKVREHVAKTGHTVDVETGHNHTVQGREND